MLTLMRLSWMSSGSNGLALCAIPTRISSRAICAGGNNWKSVNPWIRILARWDPENVVGARRQRRRATAALGRPKRAGRGYAAGNWRHCVGKDARDDSEERFRRSHGLMSELLNKPTALDLVAITREGVAPEIMAEAVLGSPERALAWLRRPRRAFGGISAMGLLQTEAGGQIVEETLGQLDEGYFA
ncbi:MAG: DUF2384 domain-containing protein [Gammaproteobacteria bacterium]|nr:DUF2384 domain-containing protein [Gammaproteobacteria bacterium]MXY06745.1 DUF2384 domain-containing protein [Gammaproteobacteria bacterium]MYE50073.1 DUF2384 domain-containing protein [Gammaproteobacteria bacterium]MYF11659.1 DUF2384 domain-containing protein [Gammaproteobacteria bacterium]MYF51915.1 DUF2384 domain-containing protein [Gammaproteobacteria bacterium]